jgi:hypothetical protein
MAHSTAKRDTSLKNNGKITITNKEYTAALAAIDAMKVNPYSGRSIQWTPESDDLIIRARTPGPNGELVPLDKLAKFLCELAGKDRRFNRTSKESMIKRIKQLQAEGRIP